MAYVAVNQYFQLVESALEDGDGELLAELISYRHPHVQNEKLRVNFESQCQAYFQPPFDELFAAHIRCIIALSERDSSNAFACQLFVVQAFQAQKEENWGLPVLALVTRDLRLFALEAEKCMAASGHKKPADVLERAADQIMSCFRVCVSDNRTVVERSKRLGTLVLVNQLFKIYFRINKLHLCKPLIRAIDSCDNLRFSKAQMVTYRYFVGKKAMFDSDFKKAAECLEYAFNHCFVTSQRNRRLILIYLIPVKMLLGEFPKRELLLKHKLEHFMDIAKAVRKGNLVLFSDALEKHESFFIHFGVFLILEKLTIITYRNLFRKVYLILGTHQLPLKAFEDALRFMNVEDVDTDEAQCILAGLIDKNYIRGYISHQHQKVVISKQNPFPVVKQ